MTIVATDASAAEAGPDTGTFTITRTGPDDDGAARHLHRPRARRRAASDYVALGTQVFIPAGSSTVTLTVTPIADGVTEDNENVDVFLITNSGLTVGSPGNGARGHRRQLN